MTSSEEESKSEENFEEGADVESSIAPSSSSVLDAFANWWCIEGIDEIYREGMQLKERGKLTHSIFKEPRVIADGLKHVLSRQNTMIRSWASVPDRVF